MNLQKALEQLGLSGADANLYLALLSVGESPVGALIQKTASHRELVYGGLKRLEQQGLVQSIEKKKIRHYQAIDPSELVRKTQEKADLAASILPDLQNMLVQTPVSVRIFEGSEGFEEIMKDIAASLKDGEEYCVIGGAGEAWYEVVREFYRSYHKKLVKRRITFKTVTFANEAEGIASNELPGLNPVRILPDAFKVPSSTQVYADKIVIQVFGERPLAIQIRSEAISAAYKQYFQVLWNMGKEL